MPKSAGENSDPSAGHGPSAAEVRAELERILRSPSFELAGRASEFLRFVVEETLAGHGDRLKGYTIGVEVFGRPHDFDAQSDPLVRVEAGRVRRRLTEYYAGEGHTNPLRINLPRGGYACQFHFADTVERAPDEPNPQRARQPLRRAATIAALAAVVAAAVLWANREQPPPANTASGLPSGPRVLVLPFENLSGDPALDYFTDGMTEEIMLRLSGFDLFVIASQTSWYYRGAQQTPETAGAAVNAGYVLTGSVRNTVDRVRVSARLVDGQAGTQLWTSAYDEDLSVLSLLAIQEKIARQVVDTIAVPYGPIFEQEFARIEHEPAGHLDTYDCILKYYFYRRTIDAQLHRGTVECFQLAVVREPRFADAWAGLALLYLDEYSYGYTPQVTTVDALERAREAARTAMDVDGDSYFANLALARVRFFSGDLEGFDRSAKRLLEISPNNAEALALIGALWTLAGRTADAAPLIENAIAISPQPPGLYYLAHALRELGAGNYEQALTWALRLDAPNWFISPLMVAATAALAGRPDVAQRASARLLELFPQFPQRAREDLAKWQIDEPLLEQLLDGLRLAGLDIA